MRRSVRRGILMAALGLGLTAGSLAHERIRVNGNGAPLFWALPSSLGIVINSTGSDDIADDSDEVALRMAIQDWNDVQGTSLVLVEDTSPLQQARTDWQSSDIHTILFDEDGSSGYFGAGSGIVAITPVWFFLSGQLIDADVLFNGLEFRFTTSQIPGRFDVQDVGAHELGHLMGLDHSGWAGATMYPYVDPTVILHRSLSSDEVRGLRDAYPFGVHGRITGTIQRASDGTPVVGAHVVARDAAGRTAASILTGATGAFLIPGLDADTYTVYVDPLDFPVSQLNLGGQAIETDFETAIHPTPAAVPAGGTVDVGMLQVGPDVALNLGTNMDDYPLRAIVGGTSSFIVRGTGLLPGSTLTASDPDLSLASVIWNSTFVSFQLTVPAGEAPGHVDLTVVNGLGETNILPAALEVTPPDPMVSSAVPNVGSTGGGTFVTITGSGFNAGARVVIGDRIYRDGDPQGLVVVDPGTITLTTLPTVGGTHDVVVLDSTGVDGRLAGGFLVTAVPVLDTIFPPSGDSAGGSEIVLRGQDFVPGLSVRIDGVDQPGVVWDSATRVRVTTAGGVPGGPYTLEAQNPGGAIATGVFAYVAQPDPAPVSTSPSNGPDVGGTTVTITGSNFTSDSTVVFGADPDTGQGGVPAASVTFVDSSTLTVETPVHSPGIVDVMLQDASSGQAGVLVAGFAFDASGGGGGGCHIRPVHGPLGPREILMGSWWLLLLLLLTFLRGRRPHPAPAEQRRAP